MHGDVAELFLAETNSMMPGEACNYLQVILDEFELLDFANSNTIEQFVKDTDACSDFFSEKFPPLHSEK